MVLEFFLRLTIAALLGTAIGLERQWRQRPAGLHTSGLVAIGAALFAVLDMSLAAGDTTRIVAGVVTGVGFIAGGVILRTGPNVSGLNTAATMWATAAVGALAGFGIWPQALAGTIGIILLNVALEPIGSAIDARNRAKNAREGVYAIAAVSNPSAQPAVVDALMQWAGGSDRRLEALDRRQADGNRAETIARVFSPRQVGEPLNEVTARILAIEGVESCRWSLEP